MIIFYAIQRDDGSLFAGFGATHRPSAPRLLWTNSASFEDGDRVCLYGNMSTITHGAVQDMTDGICCWVQLRVDAPGATS